MEKAMDMRESLHAPFLPYRNNEITNASIAKGLWKKQWICENHFTHHSYHTETTKTKTDVTNRPRYERAVKRTHRRIPKKRSLVSLSHEETSPEISNEGGTFSTGVISTPLDSSTFRRMPSMKGLLRCSCRHQDPQTAAKAVSYRDGERAILTGPGSSRKRTMKTSGVGVCPAILPSHHNAS
jgi:hypothetical protein